MSKWYEVAYSICKVAYVEVNDDEGKEEAQEVALDNEFSGDADVEIDRVDHVTEDEARRHGIGGEFYELDPNDRK